MPRKTILAIGIDPKCADFSAFPGLTPELVQHYIDAQIERVRELGYDAASCLVGPDDRAEDVVRSALGSKHVDCVVIGAGLREPPQQLLLFEKIINLVHELAPRARICFNTTPADTATAVQRWVGP